MSYALAETNEDLAAIELAAMTRNVVAFMFSRSAVATNAGPMAATAWRSPAEGSSEEKAATPVDAAAVIDAREECVGGNARAGSEMLTAAAGEPGWWNSAAAVWLPGWGTKLVVDLER